MQNYVHNYKYRIYGLIKHCEKLLSKIIRTQRYPNMALNKSSRIDINITNFNIYLF